MIHRVNKGLGFLKTTALGGLLFLLPLIVLGALLGQVVPIVMTVAELLSEILPFKTPGGIALIIGLAIIIVMLICFGAGLLARRSFAKRISRGFEKNLLLLFPRYAIFKEQIAASVGDDENKPNMKPVVARFDDSLQIGLEVERSNTGLVTVYLPSAPDPWSGNVVFLEADRVERLSVDLVDATSTFEQLGRNGGRLLSKKAINQA